MKNKLIQIFTLALFVVFTLAACASPAVQGLAQLPENGRELVFILLSAALTWVLLKLSEISGFDLSGYAPAIATALAPLVIAVIESYLQLIPSVFDDIVVAVINYIVLLVGSLGTFFLLKRKPATLR